MSGMPSVTSVSAISMLLLSPLAARAQFVTGFEAPTYNSGAIVSQDSWTGTRSPSVLTASEITTALETAGLNGANPVHSGTQALLATGVAPNTGSSSIFRPITGLESSSLGTVDFWARPLTPGPADSTIGTEFGNIFLTLEDGSGVRAAAIRFGATGNDQIDSTSIDVFSEGLEWIPTGVTWDPDVWYNLRLEADYASKTYDVFVNGTRVQSAVGFYDVDSASLSRVRVFRGSNQAGMIVDDLQVFVPEPGAMGLIAAGGAVLLGWRRPR